MSYFDCSDAEGLDLGDTNDVECIHGVDLLEPCAKCKPMAADGIELDYCKLCGTAVVELCADGVCVECKDDAADGGEEDDDYMERSQESFVSNQTTLELVSLRNAIEIELKRRKDDLAKDLQAVEHALNGTKPRARRSDAGRPRQKPANEVARDEKGVAV